MSAGISWKQHESLAREMGDSLYLTALRCAGLNQVQAARGGIPTEEMDWIDLGQFTRSPYIHVVKDDQPTTYAYRARYVGHNLRRGPFGDPAVCTVSV